MLPAGGGAGPRRGEEGLRQEGEAGVGPWDVGGGRRLSKLLRCRGLQLLSLLWCTACRLSVRPFTLPREFCGEPDALKLLNTNACISHHGDIVRF